MKAVLERHKRELGNTAPNSDQEHEVEKLLGTLEESLEMYEELPDDYVPDELPFEELKSFLNKLYATARAIADYEERWGKPT